MTTLTVILVIVAILLALTGIVGAIVPALPGPPLAFAGLLTTYFVFPGEISGSTMIVMFTLTVVVSILDYVAPIIMTKMGGGSKSGVTGTTIGTIVGLFFMPAGIIWGPFLGALIGELIHGASLGKSIKVAFVSFISFLLTTGFKLILSIVMTFLTMAAAWSHIMG